MKRKKRRRKKEDSENDVKLIDVDHTNDDNIAIIIYIYGKNIEGNVIEKKRPLYFRNTVCLFDIREPLVSWMISENVLFKGATMT